MEKLNITKYREEIPIIGKPTENSEAQKQKNSIYYNRKETLSGILISLIILPELLIFSGKNEVALSLYAGTLGSLALVSVFVKEKEIRNLCQALLLLPTFRLINFSMPTFPEIPLLSIVFIYVPMLISLTLVAVSQQLTYEQLGLKLKNIWYYAPAAILIGLILGQGEYSTMQTTQLISDLSFISILKLISVMLLVGITEEIMFRSIIQTRLEEIFGVWSGLTFSSLLFGLMISSDGNPYELLYAFFVGLLFGYTFQKTRNLPFIAMTHGFINVFSFGVIPYLGHGFGFF